MKIFISYSTEDFGLVSQIEEYLGKHAEVFYWKKDKVLGDRAWGTIFNWIDQSDLIVVVITGHTVSRAMAVGQELGHARAKLKKIIPIVASEVPQKELGFLSEITYQPIERQNPAATMQAVEEAVADRKLKIEQRQAILLIGGIIALIFLASQKSA
jgi:hypothetical protein